MLLLTQTELFIGRCAELTSKETTSGLMVPLIANRSLAPFILDALKGAHQPYGSIHKKRRFYEGPLGSISEPSDLLTISEGQRALLSDDFKKMLEYLINYLDELGPERHVFGDGPSSKDEVIEFSECFMRYLVGLGFSPSFLNKYFSKRRLPQELLRESQSFQDVINNVSLYFQGKKVPRTFTIYTPRLLGRGGEDRGFKSIRWDKLPSQARDSFSDYLSQELRIEPDLTSKQHDEGYEARYDKWRLEMEGLALSKYLKCEITSCDPYSAAEEFREEYGLMKNVVYISRKGTGKTTSKSSHYEKRNTGRSPVQLQDFSVVIDSQNETGAETVLVHLDAPSFPYQKLKNEFDRQRELIELFYTKCAVFRQLAKSYSNSLEAFANLSIEDVFRNLAVATELAFAKDSFDGDVKARMFLLNKGSRLLTLDWFREQFQSLSSLTKRRSPGKSEEKDAFQTHLNLIDDEKWSTYSQKIRVPEILKWRREQLFKIISNSQEIGRLQARFETELTILWHARHQFAHRAYVFREGYFVALLLNLFRVALDFRFSCYAIWLEWHSGRVIEGGKSSPNWCVYEDKFVDGWKEEFGKRVEDIESDFDEIKGDAGSRVKQLVLGAGYVGLAVHPKRRSPARPLTV